LEDLTNKRRQLEVAIDKKRFDLLELKRAQLEGLKRSDPALNHQIDELAAKLRAYAAPPMPVELPKNVVRLGKKQDGRVVPVQTALTAVPAE
jgi:hypothetical protein